MTTRKRPGRDLRDLCARTHDEDGIDPRYLRNENEPRPVSRKDMQLCKQVLRTLAAAMQGCADTVLAECEVLSVEPFPHAGRLHVVVAPRVGAPPVAGRDVVARLGVARGFLRSQLVGVLSRKRIPELVFALGPSLEVLDGQ